MLRFNALILRSVLVLLALVLVAGPVRAANQIESVAIASESGGEVVLDVVYSYDGDQGSNVAMSAVMAHDGKASQHYAYRPGGVEPGRHRTRVAVSTAQDAPDIFSTNQIEVAMYVGGETITRPDGTSSTMLFQNAQPPMPPTAPPDPAHASWLNAENERLLGIIGALVGHDEQSIQNYLEREGADRTVYQRIEARTQAVGWLVSP